MPDCSPAQETLQQVAGRRILIADGRALTACYSETHPHKMHLHNRQMAAAGVEVFMLIVRGGFCDDWHTSYFWRDEGVYGDEADRADDVTLDRQAAEILDARPDAFFMVRWGSEVPKGWAEKHLDELQRGPAGARREASYASRLAAEGRAEMARQVVRYCESRPWGSRVIGYAPFGQDEGTTNLAICDTLFDEAPVVTVRFREFLRRRYASDCELRKAWGDEVATLATARPPTEGEWERARQGWMHWPDPKALRRYQDFFLMMRETIEFQRATELGATRAAASRPVFAATDALKQPMMGWLIRDAFEGLGLGMNYRNILLASGSIDVGGILDRPELDALITPADYTARSCGFGFAPEGIGDSLVLRGKTIFVEDDARSWATNERNSQGAWRTVEECRAGLLRNLAICASRGFIPYWMNVGLGFFDDPDVLDIVAEQIPVRRALLTRPHVHTEHAIAMILDDSSPLDEDFTTGFQNLACLRQRNDHLARTGLPYRVYLLSDVEREDFPSFRAYLFPNLFRLTPERLALIRRKLMRNGSMLIFGPGTAIGDGTRLGPEFASELLGIPMELDAKQSARRVLVHAGAHPALAGIAGTEVYGDSYSYGPILQPAADFAKSGAVELGKVSAWWYCNRAGLVLKPHPDCSVVFSMATPLPAALLRSLALHAGCCPWSDFGDVVAASGNMLMVHTVRPGRRQLRIPQPATVVDAVTGKTVCRGKDRFTVTLKSPDTRVFLIEQQ